MNKQRRAKSPNEVKALLQEIFSLIASPVSVTESKKSHTATVLGRSETVEKLLLLSKRPDSTDGRAEMRGMGCEEQESEGH